MNRRSFLRQAGVAAGLSIGPGVASPGRSVSIVVEAGDRVATAAPVKWAAEELERSLSARGVAVRRHERIEQAAAGEPCIVAAGAAAPAARGLLKEAGVAVAAEPEALGLVAGKIAGKPVLLACGSDVRGLVYALLELADRAQHGDEPLAALAMRDAIVERPANVIRSVTRCFVSDVEDKPWYNDRSMWPPYLSMLAAQRFNRFSLAFGIGYDFTRNVRDCYFHFPYPFLLDVPGYQVRAAGLPDAERDRNLEMLRFISDEAAARGLHFQLGLWTHAYRWTDSPNANYTIEGLTPEKHAAYSRDALRMLLKACPAIRGVTFRVHGESGVPEGSYDFWKTVFDALVRSGRRIEIDMHAKGMDQKMIDVALGTGMPVNISPKYWAEHMGLAYHQAAIRELEMPRKAEGFFALSAGARRFLRYGYGDLLKEDRRYGVLHRIWPGTQRVLLWGDPALAAGYGRASSFCGSLGVEICEPLSFKGRRGSGHPGGRCAYADTSLNPRYDWAKFLYTYRVWGRHLYNPQTDPDTWRRLLRTQFHAAAPSAEAALANASRILPLATTARAPSASNNGYWPEMYTNMPIVDPARNTYKDTPSPKQFGTVSPLDPELFSEINDFAAELLSGERSGKYSPLEVAQWMDDFAQAAAKHLAEAETKVDDRSSPEFRRMAIDVAIQSGLGRFYASKLRAGVLYALYERSGDPAALLEALARYRTARAAWLEIATRAKSVYQPDITYGGEPHLRGHWLDRLPAIDADITDMEKRYASASGSGSTAKGDPQRMQETIQVVSARPQRVSVPCRHTPAARFRPGQPLEIELSVEANGVEPRGLSVRLHYRQVNQAERYRVDEMQARDKRYRAVIPAEYTKSLYPLEYFFELKNGAGAAWLYPGFEPDLSNQPYFVVRRA